MSRESALGIASHSFGCSPSGVNSPSASAAGFLSGILKVILERHTLGGRFSPEAASAIRLIVEGIDQRIGRPIAAAKPEEVASVIDQRLMPLMQATFGMAFIFELHLRQPPQQFLLDLGPTAVSEMMAGVTSGLSDAAAGNALQSFHTLRRHLPRLANRNDGAALVFGLKYFAAITGLMNPPVAAPEVLAAYLRDRANDLAAMGIAKRTVDPSVGAAVDKGREEDTALARAVMALWNRKGREGDATIPG